ncbi:MAG: tetratricopeptide repeat protein [Lentisphaerae bacterium]|nr:tetratricopeptide repeat protein [Lentisphaerota bacterium]
MITRSHALAAALCAAMLAAPAARAQGPASPRTQREEAAAAYRAGDTERAIALYEELAAADPRNPDLHRDLMRLLNAADRYADCARVARQLIALGADDRDTYSILARALHRGGQWREALEAYAAINQRWPGQPDVHLARAQVLEALRDWEGTVDELAALRREQPGFTKALPTQARALAALGRHAESAETWEQAAVAFPDQAEYRYAAATEHFQAGQVATALDGLRTLLAANPDHARARNFLVQYATVQGDFERAIDLLESAPLAADPVPVALRIAGLHLRQNQPTAAIQAIDVALGLQPNHGDAILLKADLLRQQGDAAAAGALFAKVAAANPASSRAWQGLSDTCLTAGDTTNALVALGKARALDPTDPILLLREARCRFAAGDGTTARQMLADWLSTNPDPPVQVLLYHGLTPRADDPLLASPVHMTTRVFDDQMRALAEAGYTAVTAADIRDWHAGQRDLPAKSVWIVFDDGRQDSFREATPILMRHGLRAGMFVAGVNADRNLPGYATWEELAALLTNGVWEVQSHGDQASIHVPVDAAGHTALYLSNRQWLADANRLETLDEWQARVAADYASGMAKMREHLGMEPVAFAWPEGDFGQEGIPNAENSAAFNLQQVRRHVALAFHQDGSGLNVRSRDPYLLTRFEPSAQATGADIVRHIATMNPAFLMQLELLQQAIRERDALGARRWLDALRDQPLTPQERHVATMRVAYVAGDFASVVSAADAALAEIARTPAADPSEKLDIVNTRARALEQLGRRQDALAAFLQSIRLKPDQLAIWLAAADTAEALRHYRLAADLLDRLHRLDPTFAKAAPARGRVLGLLERYAEAADAWAEAATAFPDQPDYRYFEGDARFRAGQTAPAVAVMHGLLASRPDYSPARDFLTRLALASNDAPAAIALLEADPATPSSVNAQMRLAEFHLRLDQNEAALSCITAALRLEPGYGEALLMQADILRRLGRPLDATLPLQEVVAANRGSLRGWKALAGAEEEAGHPAASLAAIRTARALDPTDPYLMLEESQARYAVGQRDASRAMLERWLADNPDPALPVLVYHGLTRRTDDPLLASRVHMTTAAFESQMRALHDGGYHAVTANDVRAWYARERDLPPKAVWIVFDDGRMDSFREATPILRRHGLKAAMFVPGFNASRNLPGYANWAELARLQTNGVWELQSHGDWASSNVIVNARGREGLFLPNRQWRLDTRSFESMDDWRTRVSNDYATASAIMAARLGQRPIAYAWPEGNFGQEGIPTAGGAAAFNQEQVRAHFALAFHQDGFGLNARTRDPAWLTRLEPDPQWTGDDLLRHLADKTPAATITLQLLKQATWEDRLHDAKRWLVRLEALHTTRAQQRLAAAIVYSAAGEQAEARVLAQDALDHYPLKEAASVLDTIARRDRPQLSLAARYWADDDKRSSWEAGAEHQTASYGPFQWSGAMRAAQHRESGYDTVREASPTIGSTYAAGLHHHIGADASLHAFNGGPDSQVGGSGTWQAEWTDLLATHFSIERAPVYTVQALNENVSANAWHVAGIWRPDLAWQLTLRGRYTDYSDDNARRAGAIELQRRLSGELPGMTVLGQFSLDDADEDREAYYTPRNLRLGRLGLQYDIDLAPGGRLRLRYLPGYGVEEGEDARVVQAGSAELTWPIKPGLDLRPAANFQRTPTYSSAAGAVTLNHEF